VPRIVLVADDSPTIQKRALGILKGEGFDVETVSNGVAAIKRLAVLHPVVIIADVSMPGRDGYEVCDFVKKSAEFSHVPVLLVASDMEPYDDARGAEVRADGIIKKPFEAHELISIVERFAARFEAETPTLAPPVAPSEAPERTREFLVSSLNPDDMPTLVQHSAPEHPPDYAISSESSDYVPTVVQHSATDFSEVSEGVAFTEHAAEETPGYSSGSRAAEMERSHSTPPTEAETIFDLASPQEFVDTFPAPEPHEASIGETSLVVKEPPASSPYAPSDVQPSERTSSFLEGMEAATPEPVFIEEPSAQTVEPPHATSEFRTVIFSAPLEIAEPVWKDETVPPPPEPESAASNAGESQPGVETPVASPESPLDQLPEPPNITPSMSATSLESFSLDEATAGQVHFGSEVAEYPLVEAAPAKVAHEEVAAELAPVEYAPVEAAPAEVAPEEVPSTGPPVEYAPVEAAPAEVAPEEVASAVAPAEYAPVEAAPTEVAPEEVASAVAPAEYAPVEAAPAEVAPEQVAYFAPVEEGPTTETASAEPAPEAGSAETTLREAPVEVAPPENTPEVAATPPAFDWNTFYSVVHKVVVKMSPPPLPVEAVEEMTRRLAEEIASEIISESFRPPE